MAGAGDVQAAIAQLHREHWGQTVAVLARTFRDLDIAEEAVQEAYASALSRWPDTGVPVSPPAWLLAVARNRALDRIRRGRRFADRLPELERRASTAIERAADQEGEMDDQLAMLFACCHPALAPDARIALTLRLVAGLETREIARAFLVSDATLAQRLVRAKRKVRDAGIPLSVPPDHLLSERLQGVLAVLYLVFNEAYAATSDPRVVRPDLAGEAIRLARLLGRLMPDEPEAAGLLALMLLHHARRAARVDAAGQLVLLPDQDRACWDRSAIAEGVAVLRQALRRRSPGPYQLQASIAALHAEAPSGEATEWPRIVALYEQLMALAPSPVIALNRAAAVAMAEGPEAGLALMEALEAEPALERYHLLPAAQADLLRRLGRRGEAAQRYRRALELATSPADQAFLRRRLAEVDA